MKSSSLKSIISKGKKEPFPTDLEVMLAKKEERPFNNPDWEFEIKFDGYRIKAEKQKTKVSLLSREGSVYTTRYSAITYELQKIKHDCIIDGEVVVLDEKLHPDFNALQNYKEGDNIKYYVFDLLWIDGYNIMELPLVDRRYILESIIPESELIQFSEDFEDGIALYNFMIENQLEGIVAKHKQSCYYPGKRVSTWLKIPIMEDKPYVIGGWVETKASGRAYGTLLIGHFIARKLYYIAHSSHGMKEKENFELLKRLQQLEIKTCPFENKFEVKKYDNPTHWVKPEIVGVFKQKSIVTPSGERRHQITLLSISTTIEAKDVVGFKKEDYGRSKK